MLNNFVFYILFSDMSRPMYSRNVTHLTNTYKHALWQNSIQIVISSYQFCKIKHQNGHFF